jgi:2-(1,2-epoxy-1,2-dihydrophenyl)acetyl-CoA isomerase
MGADARTDPADAPGSDDAAPERQALRVEVAEGVATLTLDRPDALNALTAGLLADLLAAFRSIARDRAVRAVVLTGAGRAFCAGQDLKERLEPDAPPLEVVVRERYNPLILAMRRLDQPIVGAVNGVAAGAGASLAFACDIRIAAETASFVLAFGRIGLVPDSGATWFLPRLVGPAKAAELALVGTSLSAADAERSGLVARVVPAEALAAEARTMALDLAGLAPVALAETKRALERSWEVDLEIALEEEAYRQGIAGATDDHAEGIAAFVEKRPPRFRGA